MPLFGTYFDNIKLSNLTKMKKIIGIFTMLGLVLLMSFRLLDFYSTMTKVDFVEGSKTLKFTTKLNTEHISSAIKINPDTAGFDAEVKKYVNNNFDVFVNGTNRNLTFTGSQVNGESVWVYYEAANIESISTLKIKNSILLEAYPKQLNLVNIAYKGAQKNITFQRGKETAEVSF